MMKGIIFIAFFIHLSIFNSNVEAQTTLRDSINKFTSAFYKEAVNLYPNDSVISSPLSAHIVLSLLSLGAGGSTLNELNKALFVPNSNFIEKNYKDFNLKLNSVPGITLTTANKIYVQDKWKLKQNFQQKAKDVFFTLIDTINFRDTNTAITTINKWVEMNTNSKIKNILDALDPETVLMLVNAIYFKGKWLEPFDPKKTLPRDFYVNPTKVVQVDMMTNLTSYRHASLTNLDAKAIEIPYSGEKASFVVVLPNKVDGLSNLEKKLTRLNVKSAIFDQLKNNQRIQLFLPKFKTETTFDLIKLLPKIGINLIFKRGRANLNGLLEGVNNDLYVSKAIQKAFIEVNEEGTEAAAATVIGASTTSVPPSFVVDHPFLYYIILRDSGEILFTGNYGRHL